MTKVTINSGWFKAAGNVYHWVPDYHVFGVGIDTQKIKDNEKLLIEVGGSKYILLRDKAKEFILKYRSFKTVGKDKRLGVVSKSILEPIDEL